MVISPIHAQLPRRRGSVVGTRRHGFLRDRSELGELFRAEDRIGLAQTSAQAPLHLASGRDLHGRMAYLWRAVDAEGEVLDVLVQAKRDKRAALKLMRKLLKKCGFVPECFITDDLRSYGAAARDLGIEKRRQRGRWRNNRAENSHQPTRRRERKMQGFKSRGSTQ